MLQLFRLQNADRIKIVYGKIISPNEVLAYYDKTNDRVYLSRMLETENNIKLIGFKVPQYLNNIPCITEKTNTLQLEGTKSTYKRIINTKRGLFGIELLLQTLEVTKDLEEILEEKKVKIGESFEYSLLSL